MKPIISLLTLFLFISLSSSYAQCCSGAKKSASVTSCSDQAKTDSSVKAYYFHATRRCATCMAVEDVSKQALKEYYGDKVSFVSINREEDSDHPLIARHKISGQTLLIIKDDKIINLTNDAFLYARTKPEKLKAKIKSTIDPLI